MGGLGVSKEVREAVTDQVLDDVLSKRAMTAKLLANAESNSQPMFASK